MVTHGDDIVACTGIYVAHDTYVKYDRLAQVKVEYVTLVCIILSGKHVRMYILRITRPPLVALLYKALAT